MGNSELALQAACARPGCHLGRQFGDARRTAGAAQTGVRGVRTLHIDRNTTGVIPPVFQTLKPLHQHRNDVAG
jgi:hypothetical protein